MEGEKGTLKAGIKEQPEPDMTGPLTVEQLAAIEDEEILNNMVRGNNRRNEWSGLLIVVCLDHI